MPSRNLILLLLSLRPQFSEYIAGKPVFAGSLKIRLG